MWPRVFPRAAYARLKIIEKGLPEKLGALARQSPRVDVPEYVDNLEEHLEDAGVWVVPLFAGSGITVKILTALSYGLPVVTTSIGCEGIVAQSGREPLIAEGADAFAEAVIVILESEELTRSLSEQRRALVVNKYDYRPAYRKWDNICGPLEAKR